MNARSWLTKSNAPGNSSIISSSQPMASISRWFVGSSSSSRSGCATSARPSITRRRQPPDKSRHARIAAELQPRDDLIDVELRAPLLVLRAHPGAQHLAHAHIAGGRHLLGEARRSRAGTDPHLARVRRDLAAQEFQQRGFARAVSAQQAHALALRHLQISLLEERTQAVAERCFVETGDQHRVIPEGRPAAKPVWS